MNSAQEHNEAASKNHDARVVPFPTAMGSPVSHRGIRASQVTLHFRQADGSTSMICNGGLVDPDTVLTAVHGILNRRSGKPLPKDRLFVRLINGAELRIGSIVLPTDFRYEEGRPQFGVDVAFLKFDMPYFEPSLEHDLNSAASNEDAAEILNGYAAVATELGDMESAQRFFLRSTQSNPQNAAAWNGLGFISSRRENFQDAIAYFTKAIAVAPLDAADFYFNRGDTQIAIGDYRQAAADFSMALDQGFTPRSLALFGRASTYLKMGKPQDADRDHLEIIATPPNKGIDYTFRSRAFRARGCMPEALIEIERLLGQDPEYAESEQALDEWIDLLESARREGNPVDNERLFENYQTLLTSILKDHPERTPRNDTSALRRVYSVFVLAKKPAEAAEVALRICERTLADNKLEHAEKWADLAIELARDANRKSLIFDASLLAASVSVVKGNMAAVNRYLSDIHGDVNDKPTASALKEVSTRLRSLITRLYTFQGQLEEGLVSVPSEKERLRSVLSSTMVIARIGDDIGSEGLSALLLGKLAFEAGDIVSAEKSFDSAIHGLVSAQMREWLPFAHIGMSLVAEDKGDLHRSCYETRVALSIFQELHMPERVAAATRWLEEMGCDSLTE
jgi:tetratricopeptide (TPR) repeat protein